MSARPAAARLEALWKLQSEIFQTNYNPLRLRTGSKILKRGLRGPAMVQYYPAQFSLSYFQRKFPELELVDLHEQTRLDDLAALKARGKGQVKKGQGKKSQMGKKK
ncbi:uncharacterized protein L969DRAFT_89676 [Mixia osmundae IAM 14324]|uniref:Small ribosomal subunit protein mS33 n=1 Tax=Mixia osmundae (strain CBS 9802 / IAM 14324 / JCM 22182 / KY 12970) TaxID=764103 RepID=G7E4T7_MIXOS|nr:uncharacterized protein L969DRAFT_89676 [Mixia osmundae IAM 14324]KEI37709.1 hypothetical protein L969DRAFT_89676 [Mixia osmundae IAM 14324]GAA97847.1 hypothetical protein E5Q_04527 [Mixia osmundae IAM 14324]